MSKQRAKGTAWETAIVKTLIDRGIQAERLPLAGSGDKGDIRVTVGGYTFTVEAKNCQAMTPAAWVDEADLECALAGTYAGFVWAHRRGKALPAMGYVMMTGDTLIGFLQLIASLRERAA